MANARSTEQKTAKAEAIAAAALALQREVRFEEWYDDIDAQLSSAGGSLTPASAAQLIARSLGSRGPLRRTLALVGPMMEHNAGRAAVARYRGWLLERSSATGRTLEAALPFLRPGEGIRLLLLIHALVVGYHAMAEPSSTVEAVLADDSMSAMRVDFRRVVAEALWMQLEGLRAARSGQA